MQDLFALERFVSEGCIREFECGREKLVTPV
jgi:hypothetical protein